MPCGNGDGLARPAADEIANPTPSAGVAVDERLWHIAFRKALTVIVTTATTSAGSPSIGMLRGHDSGRPPVFAGIAEGSR